MGVDGLRNNRVRGTLHVISFLPSVYVRDGDSSSSCLPHVIPSSCDGAGRNM